VLDRVSRARSQMNDTPAASNVRHWHGSSADQPKTHFAIAEVLNGSTVTWVELVTDEIYRVGARRSGCTPN
jgi:hypothetical protein